MSFQQKVFKQKVDNYILDTAVCILCDLSGSMGGAKYIHSGRAAVVLNDTLAKINVPVEILGFSEIGTKLLHVIFKDFYSKVSDDELSEYFGKASKYMGNNADGESILWAYSRLIKHKARRKLLIVLSDGSPAAVGGEGDIMKFTKDTVKYIEDKTPVDIYGIGIMDSNVKRIYRQNSVIDHADELEEGLLTVLKNKILDPLDES